MSLDHLLPTLHALPRADKLRVIHVLVSDIASEEAVALPDPGADYPIWSPHEAFDGAATLLQYAEMGNYG